MQRKKDGRQANDTLSLNSFNKTPKGGSEPIYHEHQRVQVYYPSVYGTSLECGVNRTALIRTSNCDNVVHHGGTGSPTPSLGDYGFASARVDPTTTRVLRAKSSLNSHSHDRQHLYDVPHRFRKEFLATACSTVSLYFLSSPSSSCPLFFPFFLLELVSFLLHPVITLELVFFSSVLRYSNLSHSRSSFHPLINPLSPTVSFFSLSNKQPNEECPFNSSLMWSKSSSKELILDEMKPDPSSLR